VLVAELAIRSFAICRGVTSSLSAPQQYGGLPGLATANKARKPDREIYCVFTESSKSASLLAICVTALLKSSASPAGKTGRVQLEWCGLSLPFPDMCFAGHSRDVNAA
jgi:hypothetical protein